MLKGPDELYYNGDRGDGPEEVGEDKIDAPACQVEELGLNPVYSKSNCFFLKYRQLGEQEVLIRIQSGNSLIPPLSSKSALFLCLNWEGFTAFCHFQNRIRNSDVL